MQRLTNIITEAQKKGADGNTLLNIIREYLQVLILKAIYQSKYGGNVSFMGGTCLRICYDLKRYSEDLDFTLDRKTPSYSFTKLNASIASFLNNTDFEVDYTVNEDKTVQKSFIRVSNVLQVFGLSQLKNQKIHVKIEVDAKPPQVRKGDIETFFVAKFNELFPILKHTDATLFAGKICALLNRPYTKGRDYYDLLWYLNRKKPINIPYLNRALAQIGIHKKFKHAAEIIEALEKKIVHVSGAEIIKDIGRFLEDPSEEAVLRQYRKAFSEAASRFQE